MKRKETIVNECPAHLIGFESGKEYCGADEKGSVHPCDGYKCMRYSGRIYGQHFIKIEHTYFEDVLSGKKTFEFRKNDRDYRVGDYVCMREKRDGSQTYTGRYVLVQIKALWPLVALSESLADYVVFTFENVLVFLRCEEE